MRSVGSLHTCLQSMGAAGARCALFIKLIFPLVKPQNYTETVSSSKGYKSSYLASQNVTKALANIRKYATKFCKWRAPCETASAEGQPSIKK